MLQKDYYFLPQSLDASDSFVRLILLSHNTCFYLVLYLPLYCTCESNANKIMVPTKFDKNKIASLVNFVMHLKGQQGLFFFQFYSSDLLMEQTAVPSQGPGLDRAGADSNLLLCSFGCYFSSVLMQVYCSKLAEAEQRVCVHSWFLKFSCGNRGGCELRTNLRLLVPSVHTLKAMLIGTLGQS